MASNAKDGEELVPTPQWLVSPQAIAYEAHQEECQQCRSADYEPCEEGLQMLREITRLRLLERDRMAECRRLRR